MRLPSVPLPSTSRSELPLWPPLLAARGPGTRSEGHSHHAMHLVLALEGELTVRVGPRGPVQRAAGVLTAPDVPHALDARGTEVLLVFLEPEGEVGAALLPLLSRPVRLLTRAEADAVAGDVDPFRLMGEGGVAWGRHLVQQLGGPELPARPPVHPRVRRLLRLLRALPPDADTSLPTLASQVGLSPGRLMHVFTDSVGVPLRPYVAWLRLQRAAAGIVSGMPLSEVALAAGFSDGAHMSRTFRRMLGLPPSALRGVPPPPALTQQPVRSSR